MLSQKFAGKNSVPKKQTTKESIVWPATILLLFSFLPSAEARNNAIGNVGRGMNAIIGGVMYLALIVGGIIFLIYLIITIKKGVYGFLYPAEAKKRKEEEMESERIYQLKLKENDLEEELDRIQEEKEREAEIKRELTGIRRSMRSRK